MIIIFSEKNDKEEKIKNHKKYIKELIDNMTEEKTISELYEREINQCENIDLAEITITSKIPVKILNEIKLKYSKIDTRKSMLIREIKNSMKLSRKNNILELHEKADNMKMCSSLSYGVEDVDALIDRILTQYDDNLYLLNSDVKTRIIRACF